jgi:hypothetical protein
MPEPCDGVWDLLPQGDAVHFINNQVQREIGAARLDLLQATGTFLRRPDEAQDACWELQEATTLPETFCPSVGIPEDCRPVFRIQALKAFVAETFAAGSSDPHPGKFRIETALLILGAVLNMRVEARQRKSLILDIAELQIAGCSSGNAEKYFAAATSRFEVGLKSRTPRIDPK